MLLNPPNAAKELYSEKSLVQILKKSELECKGSIEGTNKDDTASTRACCEAMEEIPVLALLEGEMERLTHCAMLL